MEKTDDSFGAWIPLSCKIDPSVTFPHGIHGVFVSQGAEIGNGCVIFHQVTVGSNTLRDSKNPGAPTLGKNVYVGAGAKIIGKVHIGDGARIGANCVVSQNVPENATVVCAQGRVILHEGKRDNTFVAWNKI